MIFLRIMIRYIILIHECIYCIIVLVDMKRKNINCKEGVIGYKRGFDSVAIIVYWVMAFVTSISVCIMNFKIIFVV